MASKALPTPTELRQLLDYCPETGALSWRERGRELFNSDRECSRWNTRYSGRPAFTAPTYDGYRQGNLRDVHIKAHRVAFAIYHGEWPDEVDHINGVRSDNRIANLRDVTRAENQKNLPKPTTNTSGVVGVHFNKSARKWYARIKAEGRNLHLGSFEDLEDAAKARKAAEQRFGYHVNHGRGGANA